VDLRAIYGALHPDVIQLSNRIADMETQEETLRNVNISMLDSLPKIPGYVYDASGGVLPGVTISLVDFDGRRIPVQRFSNAEGYFEIESMSGLDLAVLFELDGFESQVLSSQDLGTGPIEVTLELSPVEEVVQVITTPGSGAMTSATKNPAKVGGNVLKPFLLHKVKPVYPQQARIDYIEGTVVISALIDEEGRVKDAFVVRGSSMLREAALECVRQWRYSTAMLNGKPWPMRLSLTVEFKLDR
jgi:TonB family protein